MTNFIDIHNHGAWGIDDGIKQKEDTIELLRQANQDGIQAIIATPHVIAGQNDDLINKMKIRIQEFSDLAQTYGIQVYMGNELFLNYAYKDFLITKNFMTLADSNYILVEFDVRNDIREIDDADDRLYEFIIRGYRPIIAHAERYFHEELDLSIVQNWIKAGCFIQVNRTSYLGLHGDKMKEHALQLLKAGMVHIIASDAHRHIGDRICKMSDVYKKIKHGFGEQNAMILCFENPSRILHGEKLIQMEKRPSFIQRWKTR